MRPSAMALVAMATALGAGLGSVGGGDPGAPVRIAVDEQERIDAAELKRERKRARRLSLKAGR